MGLTLGVAVLIIVLSVMNGFDRELQNRILGMVPHGSVYAQAPIKDWETIVPKVETHPEVVAAAPFSQLQGMLAASGNVSGVFVSGVVPEMERKVSIIDGYLTSGSIDDLKPGSYNIILGQTLALQLGLLIGDKVTLVLPEASVTPAGVLPRFKRFTVAGTFEVGAELDGTIAVIHLADAGKLLRQPGTAQGIRIKVDDLFMAPAITREVAWGLDGSFYSSDWTYTHGNLFNAIKMEKAMIALLLLLIVAVAAFNIVSSLVMLVREKQSDIAILRTLGATPGSIRTIFIIQGTLIGALGTVVGTALGVSAALTIGDFAGWLDRNFQLNLFSSYFINYLPSELRSSDVIIITSAAFILSIFATIYPASRAAKIEPAEALRYE